MGHPKCPMILDILDDEVENHWTCNGKWKGLEERRFAGRNRVSDSNVEGLLRLLEDFRSMFWESQRVSKLGAAWCYLKLPDHSSKISLHTKYLFFNQMLDQEA